MLVLLPLLRCIITPMIGTWSVHLLHHLKMSLYLRVGPDLM